MNKAMNATLKLNLRMFDTSVPANTTEQEACRQK